MFGLAYLVVSAEREWREKAVNSYEEARPEARAWWWRHRTLILVAGVLALLIVGANSA